MQLTFDFDTSTIICETQTLISKLRNYCKQNKIPNRKRQIAQIQIEACLKALQPLKKVNKS